MLAGKDWKDFQSCLALNVIQLSFDLQLIVSMDGASGMCYEHTASEGVAVVTAMLNIFKYLDDIKDDQNGFHDENEEFKYQKMDWKLSDDIKETIWQAAVKLDKLDFDTDDEVFVYYDFGKSFIKTCNCSPDAFLQMSLQLTYYRLATLISSVDLIDYYLVN
jgi:choline O-acetyltransferase